MFFLAETSGSGFLEDISNNAIPVVAIAGGLLVAMISIIFGVIQSIAVARAREHTKRELAAYVAEGSMEPDKAIAILNAGNAKKCKSDSLV